MMTEYINYGETELPIDIKKVEAKYGATYIGDFALKTRDGNWTEMPAQVYWQPTPPVEGYSNYFGIITRGASVYITSAQSIADVEIDAVKSGDEILYSRYRWDYRQTLDGKCAIDGGRDYTKIVSRPEEFLTLKLDGPALKIIARNSAEEYWMSIDGNLQAK
jgi:hypothetical protein